MYSSLEFESEIYVTSWKKLTFLSFKYLSNDKIGSIEGVTAAGPVSTGEPSFKIKPFFPSFLYKTRISFSFWENDFFFSQIKSVVQQCLSLKKRGFSFLIINVYLLTFFQTVSKWTTRAFRNEIKLFFDADGCFSLIVTETCYVNHVSIYVQKTNWQNGRF